MATPPRGRERKPRCGAARAPRFPRSRRPSASKSSRTRGQGSDLPAGHTVRVRAAPRPSKSTPLPVSLGQLAQCRDGSGGRGVRGAVAGRTEGAGPHLHLTHTSAGSVSFRRGCTPQNTSRSEQRTHSGAPAAPGGSGGAQPSTVAAGVPPAGTGALACQCVPCEKQGALPVERPWWGSGAAGGARTRARARPCSQTLACCLIEAFRNSCCETRALAFGRRDSCAERWWLADARLRLLKAEGAVDCVGLRSDAQLERGDCLVLYIEHTQHDRALRDRGRRQLAPSVTTSTS